MTWKSHSLGRAQELRNETRNFDSMTELEKVGIKLEVETALTANKIRESASQIRSSLREEVLTLVINSVNYASDIFYAENKKYQKKAAIEFLNVLINLVPVVGAVQSLWKIYNAREADFRALAVALGELDDYWKSCIYHSMFMYHFGLVLSFQNDRERIKEVDFNKSSKEILEMYRSMMSPNISSTILDRSGC